jgi:hypothetical protein
MATFGSTLIDTARLDDEKDLALLLAHTRDLARLSNLLVMGLRSEEDHSAAPSDYDDWALLHSVVWPLERACERAIRIEAALRADALTTP